MRDETSKTDSKDYRLSGDVTIGNRKRNSYPVQNREVYSSLKPTVKRIKITR